MDKHHVNTDSSPTTQSDGDGAKKSDEEEKVTDQYSSRSQNKTTLKDFIVCTI